MFQKLLQVDAFTNTQNVGEFHLEKAKLGLRSLSMCVKPETIYSKDFG